MYMKKDEDKWIEDVLGSTKGSQRAQPSSDLFSKIEQGIRGGETKVIPLFVRRISAAAAVAILVINGFAIRQIAQSNDKASNALVNTESETVLLSNFEIYE